MNEEKDKKELIFGDDSDDSDDELEEVILNKIPLPYKLINDNLMINAKGLLYFVDTSSIKVENFTNIKSYTFARLLYGMVAESAVYAVKEVHKLTNMVTCGDKYKTFGLDHMIKEPKYKKFIRKN